MLKNNWNLQTLALLIPFFGLLLWTISVSWNHSSGDTGRVRIVGYDPVDILSGHYLRFRYDFGSEKLCEGTETKGPDVCACLGTDSTQVLFAKTKIDCGEAGASCPRFVRGACTYGSFLTGSERFYFPENYASVLAIVPEGSFAEIRLNAFGEVALQNIFVDSQPILEYAKMKLEAPKP